MSDKDRRIWMLNADLQAGRVKLPVDHEFKREYLGEWKDDRADAMAYAATATVAHRCALCSEVLSTDPNASGIMLDVVTEQHHAVCPARPIEIGETVRIVRVVNDVAPEHVGKVGVVSMVERIPRPANEVAHLEAPAVTPPERPIEVGERVKITNIIPSTKIGTIGTVTAIDRYDGVPYKVMDSKGVTWWCSEVERIPRPAESKAALPVGDWVRWWPDDTIGRHADCLVVSATEIRIEHIGPRWSTRLGNVGDVIENGPGTCTLIPRPAEAQATCEHPIPWQGSPEGWRCLACGQPTGRTLDTAVAPPPPAPVLVDPLDVEYDGVRLRDLLVHDERQRQEDHAWDEFAYGQLAPAQRAAVSAHWSAALRAKVTASDEAERRRVCVDPQDEP